MGLLILAALILLPLTEIAVFIVVGDAIGVLPTIGLTLLTAVAGTMMLRQQGLSLLRRMQAELDAGRAPGEDLLHGAMIVLASILLLIPGFVTDTVGLLLFVPAVRRMIAGFVVARADVIIVNSRREQRGTRVVDLDETEWGPTGKPADPARDASEAPPRISPWRADR
ncbi:FxsA family protein [Polymorphum gilvum]|uniref:FxsA cytoplasmic membrane protein n=1 Tax=Polymorphum gilvum (strain LMG 25793 / CGMCC 1.9160 / SL003B-26A1) TaxID=991905 RepID=F2IVF3_POLGS|nr:FxsA family protein [Polymorphum gilvum]ADZ72671.1 FxsA cytoplasmic membrane protein [Polymorphum gilvum SL003B-26A1]